MAGEQGPPEYDPRSAPYPMPPLPLDYNLERLKAWGADAGSILAGSFIGLDQGHRERSFSCSKQSVEAAC